MSNPSSPTKDTGAKPSSPSKSPVKSSPGSMYSPNHNSKEGASIERQFSEPSQQAINKLDQLEDVFAELSKRVENIDKSIDVDDFSSLIRAKNDLAQIIAELEILQSKEIDAISSVELVSGKDDVKVHRKSLNIEIGSLLEQALGLHSQLESVIRRATPSRTSPGKPLSSQEPELNREEVAKLLLLVSRAFSINQISNEQRNLIKDQICLRKGYLRNILRENDIAKVMGALSQIGK